MKRIKIELWSLGFAAAALLLCANVAPVRDGRDCGILSSQQAIAESARYLDGAVRNARYDARSERWQVTDGRDVAWLDGHTGDLVEIELAVRR